MAKIIKSNLQLDALKLVNDGLKQVQKIEAALKETGNYSLSIKVGSVRVQVADRGFIERMLLGLKKETIKEIKANSTKYNIELSDEDLVCMGMNLEKAEPEKEVEFTEELETEIKDEGLEKGNDYEEDETDNF